MAKKIKLNAPIVPGSTITERALAAAVNAAAKTKYGGVLQSQQQAINQAKQAATDIGGKGGFYDQYLAQLATHVANINAIATQSNAQMAQLPTAVTGLATAETNSLQNALNANAAARGAQAGNLGPQASGAATTSQALAANYAAQQTGVNQANQNYADTLAHVVAPAQKLTAQTQAQTKVQAARQARQETKSEVGAFKTQTAAQMRSDEEKNVLAQETLTGNQAVAAANVKLKQQGQKETQRHDKAEESAAQARIDAEQQKAITAAAKSDNKRVSSGPFAGLTAGEVNNLTDQQAAAYVKRYNTGKSKPVKVPKLTLGQANAGLAQLGAIKARMNTLIGQKKMTQTQAEQRFNANHPGVKSPWLTRAAGDAARSGHLWNNTVQNLVAAGFDPSQVASALGVKTYAQWLRTPAGKAYARTQANTQAYSHSGGNLGGSGHS
jgi:hypothetical protein